MTNEMQMMTYEEPDYISDLESQTSAFCSMVPETDEDRAVLFSAVSNPEFRISDCVGQTVFVKDVYVEQVKVKNEADGTESPAPRVVLIDKDGKGWASVSKGVFGALSKLFRIYGMPQNWEHPLALVIKQISKGKNRIITFDVARPTTAK